MCFLSVRRLNWGGGAFHIVQLCGFRSVESLRIHRDNYESLQQGQANRSFILRLCVEITHIYGYTLGYYYE